MSTHFISLEPTQDFRINGHRYWWSISIESEVEKKGLNFLRLIPNKLYTSQVNTIGLRFLKYGDGKYFGKTHPLIILWQLWQLCKSIERIDPKAKIILNSYETSLSLFIALCLLNYLRPESYSHINFQGFPFWKKLLTVLSKFPIWMRKLIALYIDFLSKRSSLYSESLFLSREFEKSIFIRTNNYPVYSPVRHMGDFASLDKKQYFLFVANDHTNTNDFIAEFIKDTRLLDLTMLIAKTSNISRELITSLKYNRVGMLDPELTGNNYIKYLLESIAIVDYYSSLKQTHGISGRLLDALVSKVPIVTPYSSLFYQQFKNQAPSLVYGFRSLDITDCLNQLNRVKVGHELSTRLPHNDTENYTPYWALETIIKNSNNRIFDPKPLERIYFLYLSVTFIFIIWPIVAVFNHILWLRAFIMLKSTNSRSR
jgi:hypothetical protein